jgi:hypothetical protein
MVLCRQVVVLLQQLVHRLDQLACRGSLFQKGVICVCCDMWNVTWWCAGRKPCPCKSWFIALIHWPAGGVAFEIVTRVSLSYVTCHMVMGRQVLVFFQQLIYGFEQACTSAMQGVKCITQRMQPGVV